VPSSADFVFVHAADLHLGGRRWLQRRPPDPDFARLIEQADHHALRALVELCRHERAALLLCAGDVIDGWCRDHRVGLGLVHELLGLRDTGCEAVLLLGNHDARTRVIQPLLLPELASVIGLGRPETRVVEHLGVALHGWSFPEASSPTDVAALYPDPLPGLLNVGLLHTSAEGTSGHPDYAPCSRRTLRRRGYDYWALGHVHARQVLATDPWIVFPGNLQGRGPREAGAKGATVVRVVRGHITSVEHRPLDAVRFDTIVVDAGGAERFDDVLAAASARVRAARRDVRGPPLVARLVLTGVTAVACALSIAPARRAAAFESVTREGAKGSALWIDDVWLDAGDAGAWRVAHP
jgi:DNA repair exonuclease SbcCD nuclease subunit